MKALAVAQLKAQLAELAQLQAQVQAQLQAAEIAEEAVSPAATTAVPAVAAPPVPAAAAASSSGFVSVPYVGSSLEGVLNRPYLTARADTVQAVLTDVIAKGVLVLEAAPHSGKTSLLQLVQQAAAARPDISKIWYINTAVSLAGNAPHNIEQVLEDEIGPGWKELLMPTPEHSTSGESETCKDYKLLLLDEGQLLHDELRTNSTQFWQLVRGLTARVEASGRHHAPMRVIIARLYGTWPSGVPDSGIFTSPVVFDHINLVTIRPGVEAGQPTISLSVAEHAELVASWNCHHGYTLVDPVITGHIHAVCAGVPGLITAVLDSIHMKIAAANRLGGLINERECARYVLTHTAPDILRHTRQLVHAPDKVQGGMEFMRWLLQNDGEPHGVHYDALGPSKKHAVTQLHRRGLLVLEADSTVTFISPLHRHYYMAAHFTKRWGQQLPLSASFADLLRGAIERLDADELKASLSRSRVGGQLYERAYQVDLYRALHSLLPETWSVSPDVGQLFGSSGYLDFVVSPHKWGIELLVNERAINAHVDRFVEDGIYYPLLAKDHLTEWAILDFRGADGPKPKRRRAEDKVWHIVFSDDFTKATMTSTGHATTELRLMGTKQLAELRLAADEQADE